LVNLSKTWLAEVHLNLDKKEFQQTYFLLEKVLRSKTCARFCLLPLYINADNKDTQARICLKISDPKNLEKFIVEKLKKIKGVRAAKVRLTLNGKIFPQGVKLLAELKPGIISAHIFISTLPGRDDAAWKSLNSLKNEGENFPVWIFRDFYEYDRAVTLRIAGKSHRSMRKYLKKHLGGINGIKQWRMSFMHQVTQFLKKEKLLKLARSYF
jgi:hypothetical protein